MSLYKSFNYIGSKTNLLDFLHTSIATYLNRPINTVSSFADIFSGTGIVTFSMINNGCKHVITNDIQHYASTISSIWSRYNIDLDKIKHIISQLDQINCSNPTNDDFIYFNYTEAASPIKRKYFTLSNGIKIDRIRQRIEQLKITNTINNYEYRILIKLLLYAVVNISNTSVVYAAFLKQYKKQALKTLTLDLELLYSLPDIDISHQYFNKDVSEFLDSNDLHDIEVTYLDPPYNSRGYDSNFHLLETISLYDNPSTRGLTGLRNDTSKRSKFCSKTNAINEFNSIINKIKSKYIFISYSSESILTRQQIIDILNINWTNIQIYQKIYKRFKSNSNGEQHRTLTEFIFAATLKNYS